MAQSMQSASGETPVRAHNLSLISRSKLNVSGIDDVISFDETGVVMQTPLGMLSVDGDGLHVTKLDTAGGDVIIEGHIGGIFYLDSGDKSGGKKKFLR